MGRGKNCNLQLVGVCAVAKALKPPYYIAGPLTRDQVYGTAPSGREESFSPREESSSSREESFSRSQGKFYD